MSMSSAAGSHAKTSALPEKAQGSPEQGPVFGTSSLGSLARYDPATLSWRTSQLSLLEEWTLFSGRFPRSGMTQSGTLFQLQPLALRTEGNGCGSWPTPQASDAKRGPDARDRPGSGGPNLLHAARTYPTPTADACIGSAPTPEMAERFRRKGRSGSFVEAVAAVMFPTPSASMMPCEGTVRLARKAWLDGHATLEEASAIAGRDVRAKQGKVPAMLPTPTVQDASNNGGPSQHKRNSLPLNAVAGGALNPTWVEWLMGFPLGWTDCGASETRSFRKSSK